MSSTFKTSLLAGVLLAFAGTAMSAPVRYEWTADTFLLSANRDLLETVTGQPAGFASSAGLWATTGGAYGSFVYDSETPDSVIGTTGASIYDGAITDWSSVMYGAGGTVIGSTSSAAGQTFVGDGNSSRGEDVVNARVCLLVCGAPYNGFTVGPWLSTISSTIWANGEFLSDQSLPDVLPPTGAETNVASFGFLGDDNVNGQIFAGNLQIVSATPVPEPSALATLALGLLGFAGLRRRRLTAPRE